MKELPTTMNLIKELRSLLSPRALTLHNAYVYLLNTGGAKLEDVNEDLYFVMEVRDYAVHKIILRVLGEASNSEEEEDRVIVSLPRSVYNQYLRQINYMEFIQNSGEAKK